MHVLVCMHSELCACSVYVCSMAVGVRGAAHHCTAGGRVGGVGYAWVGLASWFQLVVLFDGQCLNLRQCYR